MATELFEARQKIRDSIASVHKAILKLEKEDMFERSANKEAIHVLQDVLRSLQKDIERIDYVLSITYS
jgi:uncharacterized protein involved in cysteine biosynthesis